MSIQASIKRDNLESNQRIGVPSGPVSNVMQKISSLENNDIKILKIFGSVLPQRGDKQLLLDPIPEHREGFGRFNRCPSVCLVDRVSAGHFRLPPVLSYPTS